MTTATEIAAPAEEKKHPEIALTAVESSKVAAIGHDAASNTLAIQFKGKNGPTSTYHYANFTAEKFAEFQAAESAGSYFGKNIKSATDLHPFVKVS